MKFLLKNDLYLLLDKDLINQVKGCEDEFLNQAERKALTEVEQWLSQRFNLEYELRSWVDYSVNTNYKDITRLRITYNEDNNEFAQKHGLSLISNGVTSGSTTEYILTKKVNSCALDYTTYHLSQFAHSIIPYSRLSTYYGYQKNMPVMTFTASTSTDASCGILTYYKTADGSKISENDYNIWITGGSISTPIIADTFSFDKINNLYQTEFTQIASGSTYITSANTWTQQYSASTIDFNFKSLVSGLTPSFYYNKAEYFNEYLLSTLDDEFIEDDRNATLVDIVASITLYHLIRKVSPRAMSQTIADSFDLAIENLKAFNSGRKQINLQEKETAKQNQTGIGFVWGQNYNTQSNDY